MKYAMIPAIIFSALSLAACGGGGGGGGGGDGNTGGGGGNPPTGTPNTNTPPKLASTSQVIDYYGDSTIWGWDGSSGGVEVQVQTPAPQIFAAALPANPPQTVNNLGKNGQTACQLLQGPDAPTSPNPTNGKDWNTLMTESNATVVILNYGINDFNATDTNARETVAEYGNCLTNLAAIAKSKGKFVIFETPNPIATPGLDQYVQSMKTIATQQGIPVIDQYANLTQLIGGNDLSQFIPDGTHPNQSTYRIKGEFAAAEFLKIEK